MPDNQGVYLISSVGANAARLTELSFATGQSRVIAEYWRRDRRVVGAGNGRSHG